MTHGWRTWLPPGFVVLSLALLVLVPIVVGQRIESMREEIQGVAEPARRLVNRLQLARASEFVSLIGFQVTEAERFRERFRRAMAMEERVLERLEPLTRALGHGAAEQLANVHESHVRWHTSLVGAGFFDRETPRAVRLQRLYERYPLYEATAMAATVLAESVQQAAEARRAEIMAAQRRSFVFTIILALLALSATFVTIRLGFRLEASAEERRRRAEEEASFRAVAEALTAALSVREVMDRIADKSVELTRAIGAYVERIAPDGPEGDTEVVSVAGAGVPPLGTKVPYPGSLTESVIGSGEPELITDMGAIGPSMAPVIRESCRGCSGLIVPLISEDRVVGTLVLLRGPEQDQFQVHDVARAGLLGDLAAAALRRVLLLEAARHHATESEKRAAELAAVIESLPDAVLIGTEAGITRVNQATFHLFGFESVHEAHQKIETLLDRIEPRSLETGAATPPQEAVFVRALRGEKAVREVIVRNLKTEEDRIMRAAAAPIHLDSENLGAVVVATDITDRIQAEEAFRQQSALVELLQRVAIAANQAPSIEVALQTTLDEICEFTRWPVGHAYQKKEEPPVTLQPTALWHLDSPERFDAFRKATEATAFAPGAGLPGQVLERGEAVWGTEVQYDPNFPRVQEALKAGIDAGFGFPVVVGDEVVAVMEFYSDDQQARDEPLLELMESIGAQLGRVVERRRAADQRERLLTREKEAHAEARRRAREEAALREAAGAVAASFTVEKVIRQIAESALDATGADGAFVQRVDIERDEVEVVATAGRQVPPIGTRVNYRGSLTELVAERGESQFLPDLSAPQRPLPDELGRMCGPCSAVELPLKDAGEVIGALFLLRATDKARFSPDEIQRAETFSDLATLAFHKVQLLEESELKRNELQRVMQSRNRLMRGFTHDVKNPLAAVDGRLQLLQDRVAGELTEKQEESVRRARSSLQSALELIEDLVELARAEAGRIEIKHEPTDLREVAREMVEEHRPEADAKDLALTVELPHDFPLVDSDPARIRQILANLISNAIKYTDKGSITVRVGSRAESGAPGPGRWIAAEVSDTGPGIPEEKQKHLFQEFTRLAPDDKRGAGLGLAISQRLAHALSGQITLTSEPGEGSAFTLWLPENPSKRTEPDEEPVARRA